MRESKGFIQGFRNMIETMLKVVVSYDYRALNQHILRINEYKTVDEILFGVARCMKEILDYEFFGFALKNGNDLDLWVDPRIHKDLMINLVESDFGCQEINYSVHFFGKEKTESGQKYTMVAEQPVKSCSVLENETYSARLYVMPRRKPLSYHEDIIRLVVRSMGIALENKLRIQNLENAATIDPLTNCYNRRALDKQMETAIAGAIRYNHPLTVVMIDIDNFKHINDTYGHAAGDKALQAIAKRISSSVRKSDLMARYGGEEFVLLLTETDLQAGAQLAETLRLIIAGRPFDLGSRQVTITASFGVASLKNGSDGTDLLRDADRRLYAAKGQGKNRVLPSAQPRRASNLPIFLPSFAHTA
ncbi:MAG: GGDEF domain-containing protein [Nitrospirales bacterium]|nr:GGDEF domain-containing protein [Nitrospirales bacterium]